MSNQDKNNTQPKIKLNVKVKEFKQHRRKR